MLIYVAPATGLQREEGGSLSANQSGGGRKKENLLIDID